MKFLSSIFFSVAFILLSTLGGSASSTAQTHSTQNSLVLMCLSAHPDDEDGATLAYYGKLKGVKTYSIFYTRGEGGQNEIGSELGEELGILRTGETLEAAKILGTEVYFLGFPDFGFSKTSKETFSTWGGEDAVLARVVYIIRALKPDIIITNHDTITTKPKRQHGNHQVVGITAYEAFEKAADPNYHPEQLRNGLDIWHVKKLFFRFRQDSTHLNDSTVNIDVFRNDTTGTTIKQIAENALRKHRSQGMGNITISNRRYFLARSDGHFPFDKDDLFSGIIPSSRMIASIDTSILERESFSPLISSENMIGKTGPLKFKAPTQIFVGLVKTYDNTLEEFLKSYKIKYELLDSNLLAAGELRKYTTIILDLRTYAYRLDAIQHNDKLLAYAHDGGNLVCFYHKIDDWNGKNFAPYPILLTSERVTEEHASVTVLLPHHPLLTKPNPINVEDWNRWVQERSLYLPGEDTLQTSAKYERLLAMSDSDEHQPSTSLLWARYGKGSYTYVSLVLYRQLRIMQDGAVKLFLNIISQSAQ